MAELTQKTIVLNHLKKGLSITQLEATDAWLITDLAGRIRDLRAEGHSIASLPDSSYGSKKRFVRYRLTSSIPRKFNLGEF